MAFAPLGILKVSYTLIRKNDSIKRTLNRTSFFWNMHITGTHSLVKWKKFKGFLSDDTLFGISQKWDTIFIERHTSFVWQLLTYISNIWAHITFSEFNIFLSISLKEHEQSTCAIRDKCHHNSHGSNASHPYPPPSPDSTFNINNWRLLTWGPGIPGGPGSP